MGKRPLWIGLTGNIACGKSTVARMLAEMGAYVIDADAIAHEVIRKGTPAYEAILRRFGPGILRADGEIDRRRLGEIVFRDPAALRDLEAIVHPAVLAEIQQRVLACPDAPAIVIEAIKLIESGFARACDSLWVVTCPEPEQVRRLMEDRGSPRRKPGCGSGPSPLKKKRSVRPTWSSTTAGTWRPRAGR
jgi:dephospho-CoA kinase